MAHSIEHIAKAIKVARQKKGLSQRALSAKIGVPQSHISKIENGRVDLQTSSLIALARALDLELILVTRTLIPAVQGLQRGVETQGRSPSQRANETTVKDLEKVRKATQKLAHIFPQTEEFTKLASTIKDLEQYQIRVPQAVQIKKLIEQLQPPMQFIKTIQETQDTLGGIAKNKQLAEQIQRINKVTRDLVNLRNALAHGINENAPVSVPAYRLNEEENDA